MNKVILIVILLFFSIFAFAKNNSNKKLDKNIDAKSLKYLYDYSEVYFRTVLRDRTLDLKEMYKKIINKKYINGADITHSMIVKRIITKCIPDPDESRAKHCYRIKTDFLNYDDNIDLFHNQTKLIDNPHFKSYYLDSENLFSHSKNKMFSIGEYGTFAKDVAKTYDKFLISRSTGKKIKIQNIKWLESNGKIITFAPYATFKHYHKIKSGKYRIKILIISYVNIFTHIRAIKEQLKKIEVKFSDKHKASDAKIFYERLGPGFEQTDFTQEVKLKKNIANSPKEKFTTGHYKVSLKDAFCGCDYDLDDNKILDTYDKNMKEQYKHNFKLELVKGDVTGNITSSTNKYLKNKAVQLIPTCKKGGLEKTRLSLTNNNGKFLFTKIPKGVYSIKVDGKIVGEVRHCKAKAKLTNAGKFEANPPAYDIKINHKIYSEKKLVSELTLKFKDLNLQGFPFCESIYKKVVSIYPPTEQEILNKLNELNKTNGENNTSKTNKTEKEIDLDLEEEKIDKIKKSYKRVPYVDLTPEGFGYIYLIKPLSTIKNIEYVKFIDHSELKKHVKCRVGKSNIRFSIVGTYKKLKVPVVGGTLEEKSVYLDYNFPVQCQMPNSSFWFPKFMFIAMPTPKKYSKLYKFTKLDDKSIRNIWQRRDFKFKSPIYKAGDIKQKLVITGKIEKRDCKRYYTTQECGKAIKTKDEKKESNDIIESLNFECNEPIDCEKVMNPWDCYDKQDEMKKKKKEKAKEKKPMPSEGMGEIDSKKDKKDKKVEDFRPPADW